MLTLTRREGEVTRIGIDTPDGFKEILRVHVSRVAGLRCQLKFEAPAEIIVLRDELERRPPQAA